MKFLGELKKIISKLFSSSNSYRDSQFYGCTTIADIEQKIRDMERQNKNFYF